MKEILIKNYWSKSEAFLLPLTGLSKSQKYTVNSYLFWENYSIDNYNLILLFHHNNDGEFLDYCRKVIFPPLTKNGLMEVHDSNGKSVMIMDMSLWSFDIDLFMSGKYSKMSKEAHDKIESYHSFYENGVKSLKVYIKAALHPNKQDKYFNNKTPIEYVCQNDTYGFNLSELQKIGELANPPNLKEETLSGIECDNIIYPNMV